MSKADTNEKKRQVTDKLFQLWCSKPELRLGQLIACTFPNEYPDKFHLTLFYIKDDDLIRNLEEFMDVPDAKY